MIEIRKRDIGGHLLHDAPARRVAACKTPSRGAAMIEREGLGSKEHAASVDSGGARRGKTKSGPPTAPSMRKWTRHAERALALADRVGLEELRELVERL